MATSPLIPAFAATGAVAYTVQAGDTFYKIAINNGVTLPALEAANPQIVNYAAIVPGEAVQIPLSTYTVQPGDTLYTIAVANGDTLPQVEAVNAQVANFNNLMPGNVIYLPLTAKPQPVPTTTPTTAVGAASAPTAAPAPVPVVAPTSAPTATVSRQSVVQYAQSLLGVPYCWGGQTPATGFDCSGFVDYVFAHFGITMMRESHDQATQGVAVAQNDLQPGDLLFFQNTDSSASLYANHVTHVGIYIGNGAMIESSSLNNVGVIVVNQVFSNPYYIAHYYGARDVIQ